MKEKGRVIEITDFKAKVCVEPSDACKNCGAKHFCQPLDKMRIIEAENTIGAKIDDEVFIQLAAGISLKVSFLVFGMPVVTALIGLILGAQYSETLSLIYGLAGFTLGLIAVKIINNTIAKKPEFLPKIVEILNK